MIDDPATTALHAALTFRTEAAAEAVFGDLFGMSRIKSTDLGAELCDALFGIDRPSTLILYDGGPSSFEVFIDPDAPMPSARFEHVCVAVADMDATLARAVALGLQVRRFVAGPDKTVVFLRDVDGNLYEIKPR